MISGRKPSTTLNSDLEQLLKEEQIINVSSLKNEDEPTAGGITLERLKIMEKELQIKDLQRKISEMQLKMHYQDHKQGVAIEELQRKREEDVREYERERETMRVGNLSEMSSLREECERSIREIHQVYAMQAREKEA